jgi:demethylmenaquinone methyltransferase/2-methoxy-6-polyprenyl-1,4-benzoquinol methylase
MAGVRCFDRLSANVRWHAFTPAEERLVAAFARRWRLRPGDRVLEPGCGAGRLTEKLAAAVGPTGRVLAFDESARFLAVARRRGLPAQARLRRVRAQDLRVRAGSFDHVVCFNVLPHLVPHARIVRRLVATLRPGGRFWVVHTASRRFINGIHRAGPPGIRSHLLPAPRALARLLAAAGLAEVGVDSRTDRFLAWGRRPRPESSP